MPKHNLNSEQVVTYYKSNTLKSTITHFKSSHKTIKEILNSNDIPIRTSKYTTNENFFNKIDTQEKAYVLGFLYADGCNDTNRHNMNITLQEGDRDVLEKIRVCMEATHELQFIPKRNELHQNYYRLTITNKNISKQLERLGCVPRKTDKLSFPKWLNKELIRHFIRGFFDGDGSISLSTNPTFHIGGYAPFIEELQSYIVELVKLNMTKLYFPKAPIYLIPFCYVRYCGLYNLLSLREFLYKDATIYLQRKHTKFFQLEEYARNKNKGTKSNGKWGINNRFKPNTENKEST